MGVGFALRPDCAIRGWTASAQFRLEMPPFERQLTTRHHEAAARSGRTDFSERKPVSPAPGLVMHGSQVLGDRAEGGTLLAKPGELRVSEVSLRPSAQDRLGQQSLAPHRDQPARIEMLGMNAPEAHPSNSTPRGIARAPGHSMIRSARPESDRGIVSPSAFAVFRLSVISNAVGCSTGRSAGRAPFKILST